MSYDSHGLEILDREACLGLLADDEIGRLAVLAGGAPLILPVNYQLDGEAIVFRTDPHGDTAAIDLGRVRVVYAETRAAFMAHLRPAAA